MNSIFEIVTLILGVILTSCASVIIYQQRDLRQSTIDHVRRVESRVDDLFNRLADLRATLPDEFIKKDSYWLDIIDMGRRLDAIQKNLKNLSLERENGEREP